MNLEECSLLFFGLAATVVVVVIDFIYSLPAPIVRRVIQGSEVDTQRPDLTQCPTGGIFVSIFCFLFFKSSRFLF